MRQTCSDERLDFGDDPHRDVDSEIFKKNFYPCGIEGKCTIFFFLGGDQLYWRFIVSCPRVHFTKPNPIGTSDKWNLGQVNPRTTWADTVLAKVCGFRVLPVVSDEDVILRMITCPVYYSPCLLYSDFNVH